MTTAAMQAASQLNASPQMVLSIEGLDTKFGAVRIFKYIRIGDVDLYIDNANGQPWRIGGRSELENQGDYISFQKGTTTKLTTQLQPDRGVGASATNIALALIDINDQISELISPGFELTDLLGRNCQVDIGFLETAFPEDFITIFRGVVQNISSGPGLVTMTLSNTDQKKRQDIFTRRNAKLITPISGSGAVSTIVFDADPGFLSRVAGPDGSFDSAISYYVRIQDEVFVYTGVSGTTLTGVTRAQLGTAMAAHDADSSVDSIIRLQENGIKLAEKLMLSGWTGPFVSGVQIKNFNYVSPTLTVPNALFFFGVNLERDYGLTVGDYVTTTGASNGANNVSAKTISSIVVTDDGSYAVINGVSFVTELDTTGTVAFRSRFDTLGLGFKMKPTEVDVAEHERLYRLFLSSFSFDFQLDEVPGDGKDFLDGQLYLPMSCYAVPRNGRSSAVYHIGPIPGSNITVLDQTNITNAPKLSVQRDITRYFVNTLNISFDQDLLSGDFLSQFNKSDATSLSEIPVGERSLTIESRGMRTSLQAAARANSTASRYLNRYKRGAEFILGVDVHYGVGFNLDIGDLVLLDTANLRVTDTQSGSRRGKLRYFEILNKSLDQKAGKVTFDLVDTNYSTSARYALMSPASLIKSGESTTAFNIKPSYSMPFGDNEYLKWDRFGVVEIRVRSADSVTRNATAIVDHWEGNHAVLQTALPFVPQADDILELGSYSTVTDQVRLVYGYMRNTNFPDGKSPYRML